MSDTRYISTDDTRTLFSQAMSAMYQNEVLQYGTLLELVKEINDQVLSRDPAIKHKLASTDQLNRLDVERHGAIRVGTPQELATLGRLFAVMGMQPVGYYDLTVASVPVHSTAFRPVSATALASNPFRVFTSLLRLELIDDDTLREKAAAILAQRTIFTPACLDLIQQFEANGGLSAEQAAAFVAEALYTFKWHHDATVDKTTYESLRKAHPLIADVVCFKGPHINHLTPRTLDIDLAQERMPQHGITAKATIEGPPRRQCPILLRQTSFMALREPVYFIGSQDDEGTHTARFGEIEQRGLALTQAGRTLYDQLLAEVGQKTKSIDKTADPASYNQVLNQVFEQFPDDYDTLQELALGFFYARPNLDTLAAQPKISATTWGELVKQGYVQFEPITYEDFLPVSAAGIFQSNLGNENTDKGYTLQSNQQKFEAALGMPVQNEIAVYAQLQHASRLATLDALGLSANLLAET